MADVVLTSALRSNLQSLQLTQSLIDATQLKLSTGKKVNSALDNPQNFFAAQALSNRASDLTRLLDGIGQSIQTVKAADKGVSSLTKLVEQAESIASSARDEAANGGAQAGIDGSRDLRGIDDFTADTQNIDAADAITFSFFNEETNAAVTTIDNGAGGTASSYGITFRAAGGIAGPREVTSVNDLLNELNSIVNTDTNEKLITAELDSNGKLQIRGAAGYSFRLSFDGGAANTVAEDTGFAEELGFGAYVQVAEFGGTAATQDTVALTASANSVLESYEFTDNGTSGVASRGTTLGNLRFNGAAQFTGADAGDNLRISVRTKTNTYTLADITGTTGIASATVGQVIDAINADTNLQDYIEAGFDEETGQITIKAINENVVGVQIGAVSDANNTVAAANFGFGVNTAISPTANNTETENLIFARGAGKLASLEKQYNSLLAQIDTTVEDAGYRGTNLLKGDTLVTYFNEDRTSKLETTGQSLKAGQIGLEQANFASTEKIDAIINDIKTALESVRDFGSQLANDLSIIQTREEFTKGLVETLSEGSDKLTLADQNEEGAKLLSLQTRQSLGVTALSLAAQSQQAILRLF